MTRQCPLFHETVLAEWRCVVIQVLFNASYHTVFNVDNLVCLIGNAALVGYDHDGHARFMQVFQNLHDLYGSLAVESTGRFVGKDNLGAGNQCTGNGYTLLLSAGQLRRLPIQHLGQTQDLCGLIYLGLDDFLLLMTDMQTVTDVFFLPSYGDTGRSSERP